MKFEVSIERTYPHPVSAVWDGLTTDAGITEWLMETNNFVPEVRHRFQMSCVDGDGHLDFYHCVVLAIEPPHRMVWSWVLQGNEERGLTEVEFLLKATDSGTTVTLIHRGDRDKDMLERFKLGWPHKLDQLADVLDGRGKTAGAT